MLHVEMSHFRKENTRGSFLIKGWFNIIICLEVANEKKPMHFFLYPFQLKLVHLHVAI